jgi:hypothetical protein
MRGFYYSDRDLRSVVRGEAEVRGRLGFRRLRERRSGEVRREDLVE